MLVTALLKGNGRPPRNAGKRPLLPNHLILQYGTMQEEFRLNFVEPKKLESGYFHSDRRRNIMSESVYKVVELVGTSTESWEKAASAAVERASQSLRDLRIAEVVQLDMQLEGGKVVSYRAKVKVSFKFEG